MANVPYYLPKARAGYRNGTVVDGVIHDGLWDPYNNQHMGMCGEKCAADFGFKRDDQDAFAIESYRRAVEASERGFFKTEITTCGHGAHTGSKARELGVNPLACIRGFADSAQDPVEFTIALSKAVPLAFNHAGLQLSDVDIMR
ncbi:hypothetical protein PsorP6_006900 [Peronosclerospora sorghi]|uniref:Uncharacterized protein n=1 Tax=Peronosclerospora sorghi TaxID=230839 RepID=A0ACC0WD86_9STRA|nr:hypothetical protein PsorP6_006900 [Peronosclerospora sorghi]